jgi:HD-like signal output (HDOD) protein
MNHVSFFWLPENKNAISESIEDEFSQFVDASIGTGKFLLPPIPSVVFDIQRLCALKDTTVKDVTECLIDDPSLTAVVLKIANTVIFNRRNIMFTDITSAVSRLGIIRVRDIVTAQSIEQLKHCIKLDNECGQFLRSSAIHSRELGATMVLVCRQFHKIDSETYAYLEQDKALLVGLLADIGLFSLLSEYQLYTEKGNYVNSELIIKVFEKLCPKASYHVLKSWGFDEDYLSVAQNKEKNHSNAPVSYLDVAKIAYYLLLFHKQDEKLEDQDIQINTAGAEVLYSLSSLPDLEFHTAIKNILLCTAF